ncbi:hypothetical protein F0562_012347 [Nyssa sinensis]|uniref:Uncharacterized protein n=1 Tax=Nyssa sinensis TaxID=561372 RepID=A0A5J4ZS43_9ASTE|nr:hypothetical protein F0562_012347 [Nyssa sinensis]
MHVGDDNDITKKVKVEAPSFDGRLDPSAFLDWLVDIKDYFDWTNYLQWCQATLHNHEKNVPKVEADTIAHNVKHRATDPKQDNDNARRDPNDPCRRKRSEDGDVIPLPKKSRRLSVFANLRKWLSEFGMHLTGRTTTFNRVDPD